MTCSPPPSSGHPQPWVEGIAVAALALGVFGCVAAASRWRRSAWRSPCSG
ncbi:hypothetical protein ACIOD2_40045 [Amycolatopsis sp. NPDC088138]